IGWVQTAPSSSPMPVHEPATHRNAASAGAPEVPELAPLPEPDVASSPVPSSLTVVPSSAAKPLGSAKAPAHHPVDEKGDKLFEAANRAHFEARDWNAALAGWDRYLAASPNGRFVPEARYNRAIALLRLDRREEAIRELTPFANGKYGTYRQGDAQSLIE